MTNSTTGIVGPQFDRPADVTIGCVLLLMSMFSFCGNGFVIYVLANKIKRRINYLTTLVLIQLAVTDFIGVLPSSFTGVCLLYGHDIPANPSFTILVIKNIIGWLGNSMPLASIYLVSILSFGRCIAIYRSFDYPVVMCHRNVLLMCGMAWLLAVLVACIPYYGGNHYTYDPLTCAMFVSLTKTFPNFSTLKIDVLFFFLNVVGVILPAGFMIGCCMAVIVRLHNKSKKANGEGFSRTRIREKSDDATSHAAVTVMLITVMFILCYGPYFINTGINFLGRVNAIRRDWMVSQLGIVPTVYLNIVIHFVLVALNSCINPCIYYLRAKKFRHDVALVMRDKMTSFTTSVVRMSSFRSRGGSGSMYSKCPASPMMVSPLASPFRERHHPHLQVRYKVDYEGCEKLDTHLVVLKPECKATDLNLTMT